MQTLNLAIMNLMLLGCFMQHVCANDALVTEDAQTISLANPHVTIAIRKTDGVVLSIQPTRGENLLIPGKTSLCTLEVLPPGNDKPAVVDVKGATKVNVRATGSPQSRRVEITYELAEGSVRAAIELPDDAPRPRWRLAVELSRGSLWSATYPQLAVRAPDAGATDNEMAIPRRRGIVAPFGRGAPKSLLPLPYPGPSAKFQFLAAYGKTSGKGFYYAAEDGEGCSKTFLVQNDPQAGAAVLAVQHLPAGRGGKVTRYRQPYDVVAGPFQGDWWHAAHIYRQWWIRQPWAAQGLLVDRKDVPDWAKQATMALRPSTSNPARTLATNLETITSVTAAFPGQPLIGTWYGWAKPVWAAKSLDDCGNGHVLPPQPGLIEALAAARDRNVHLMAYIQSMIYDARLGDADAQAARKAVTRDAHGGEVPYGSGKERHLLAMCRASEWWQTRMVDMCRNAVQRVGFDGVYLDSFGKGAPECFAADHGHPVGGGNTLIASQRVMAQRVRQAIREKNPQAIMSGEDPVEAFRDLIDVHLYAVNVSAQYRPISRVIWGDYSLGHGRVLGFVPSVDTLIDETAMLFLEGTIPGRLYCDGVWPFAKPEYARELQFLQRVAACTQQGLEWLRFGEYLHPLTLDPEPPTVSFTDSVEKQRVELPGVVHSVTRSHRDGSVAIVLVNLGTQPYRGRLPIDPGLRNAKLIASHPQASLIQLEGESSKTLASQASVWSQPVELQPREILMLVLR